MPSEYLWYYWDGTYMPYELNAQFWKLPFKLISPFGLIIPYLKELVKWVSHHLLILVNHPINKFRGFSTPKELKAIAKSLGRQPYLGLARTGPYLEFWFLTFWFYMC